jgi:hypothetical protein
MKTQPPFTIGDAFPDWEKITPVEKKPKIPVDLPEKNFQKKDGEEKPEEDSARKDKQTPPPDPSGNLGNKIDVSA